MKENKKGSKEHINIFILIDATEKDVMHFLLALRHNNYYTGKMYKPCATIETTLNSILNYNLLHKALFDFLTSNKFKRLGRFSFKLKRF